MPAAEHPHRVGLGGCQPADRTAVDLTDQADPPQPTAAANLADQDLHRTDETAQQVADRRSHTEREVARPVQPVEPLADKHSEAQ